LPVELQRLLSRTVIPHTSAEELDDYAQAFPRLLEVIRLLHDEGIPLWPGTDDNTGFTLHRELELYVAAGIPASETLRIATQDCATHVGLGHTQGSIERGKVASFVLLDGDPTADISAVRRARAVVKNGDLYFPSEIYAELNIEPFCAPPQVISPAS
jgi:imidazolonepropionase-like amidohydrolase